MRLIDAELLENLLLKREKQLKDEYGSLSGACNGAYLLVKSQPTVNEKELKSDWIKCSDRLPNQKECLEKYFNSLNSAEEKKICETALQALQEKVERENLRPLTLEQLKERYKKPVWLDIICEDIKLWIICGKECKPGLFYFGNYGEFPMSTYGIDWVCYDNEPKGDH